MNQANETMITTVTKKVGVFNVYESEDERVKIEFNGKECYGALFGDKILFTDQGAEFAIRSEKGLVGGIKLEIADVARVKRYVTARQAERKTKAGKELVTCWECGRQVERCRARVDGPGFYCGC